MNIRSTIFSSAQSCENVRDLASLLMAPNPDLAQGAEADFTHLKLESLPSPQLDSHQQWGVGSDVVLGDTSMDRDSNCVSTFVPIKRRHEKESACCTGWIRQFETTFLDPASEFLSTYRVDPGIRNHGFGPSQRVSKLTQMKSEPSQPVSSKRGL